MNLRSVLSHRTAQSQPQWLPSWTSLQRFREISVRLWKDKQIRVSHWTHTGQTEATPGIYKDNSNYQKLTAVHRSPSSKCQTGDTDFGPWKLDVVRVFSDNPISSNAASSREGLFPWGLGQEASWKYLLCAVQRFMLCTQLISKTLRENYFSQTPLALHITTKCTPGSKYTCLVCKAFPWP